MTSRIEFIQALTKESFTKGVTKSISQLRKRLVLDTNALSQYAAASAKRLQGMQDGTWLTGWLSGTSDEVGARKEKAEMERLGAKIASGLEDLEYLDMFFNFLDQQGGDAELRTSLTDLVVSCAFTLGRSDLEDIASNGVGGTKHQHSVMKALATIFEVLGSY